MKPQPIKPASPENMVKTMSFSLCAGLADHGRRKTPGPENPSRERMHPQSSDELSAPVALLQSRILSAVPRRYSEHSLNRKENPGSALNRFSKMI
jgi:hypothetical protein